MQNMLITVLNINIVLRKGVNKCDDLTLVFTVWYFVIQPSIWRTASFLQLDTVKYRSPAILIKKNNVRSNKKVCVPQWRKRIINVIICGEFT